MGARLLFGHDFIFGTIFFSARPGQGGGGVIPYMGYIGTCRGIGYGFRGSRSLNRVCFFTLWFLYHGYDCILLN